MHVPIVLLGVALIPAAPLHAQTSAPAPELGVGAGYAFIWYTEEDYGALALLGGVRFPISPLVSLEPELTIGRDAKRRVFPNADPAVPATETNSARTTWSLGANVILSRRSGLLRPFGGGGGGVYWDRSTSETVVAAGRPNAGIFRTERSTGPRVGGQGLAGLDVQVAAPVAMFVAFRADLRAVSGGGLGFQFVAGTRVRFR